MSGAPVSIAIIDPAVGGASHDLSNELVVSGLVLLAARHDCMAVIASPPRQSFQLSATIGQPVCRNVHYPDGIMVNGQIRSRSNNRSSRHQPRRRQGRASRRNLRRKRCPAQTKPYLRHATAARCS